MTVYKVVLAAPTGSIHLVQYTENAPHLIYLYESGITTTTTTTTSTPPLYGGTSQVNMITCPTTNFIQTTYFNINGGGYGFFNYIGSSWKYLVITDFNLNYDGDANTLFTLRNNTTTINLGDLPYQIDISSYTSYQNSTINFYYNDATGVLCSSDQIARMSYYIIDINNNSGNTVTTTLTFAASETTTTTTTSSFATSYLIYNFHAVVDSKNITALGWSIPSKTTYENIISHLGGYAASLAKLKSTTSWSTPGNNSSGFNAKSNGGCNYSPSYTYGQGSFMLNWTSTAYDSTQAWHFGIQNDSAWLEYSGIHKWIGGTIRAYRSTANPDGTLGVYNGNDGKAYQTVAIGGIEITTQDLEETKFRDNSLIPYISDGTIWYNNGTPCSTYYGGLS